jgi:hypothetical protein
MYRTKRLGLVLTTAEKTAVVQMAESGLSQSALAWTLIRYEREPGHSSRLSVIHCACLALQPCILLVDQTLIQLLEERRRLAQRLLRRQLTLRPGADGACVVVGQFASLDTAG